MATQQACQNLQKYDCHMMKVLAYVNTLTYKMGQKNTRKTAFIFVTCLPHNM